MTDAEIRALLERVRTVAVVGWSPKAERPSHRVAAFLEARGYRVIRVNPGQAGAEGVAARLADIREPVDMVDIFRRSEHIPEVVDEALSVLPGLSAIWMQLGLSSPPARAAAERQGLAVVEDRCPAIEIPRLFTQGWRVG